MELRTAETPAAESRCVTPLGLIAQSGLANLRAFGAQADRLEYPYMGAGGFIVPGREPAAITTPGMEHDHDAAAARKGREWHGGAPREKAGPAARARRRQTPEAAPGASARAVECRLTSLNLDLSALVAFHPLTRVVASTEMAVYLNIPIGMIPGLPIGARLTLEVPLVPRERLTGSGHGEPSDVPDVRAWAVWEGGIMHRQLIVSHHRYPDQAICANMAGEWIMGVHPLHDYVAFCVLWAAKELHNILFGFYPGPQHYPAAVRVQRDRSEEFCGCGKHRRYRDCCRDDDLAIPAYDRWRGAYVARMHYINELGGQGR